METQINPLESNNTGLYPFYSYILQDVAEIGSSPDQIVKILNKYCVPKGEKKLNILELGCAKGAISVKIASGLNCKLTGIDAYSIFIEQAKQRAQIFNVSNKCTFEVGDIRVVMRNLKGFDIAILGSLGNVAGSLRNTLLLVKNCLNSNGYLLFDEVYNKDIQNNTVYYTINEIVSEIESTGFQLVSEFIYPVDELMRIKEKNLRKIENRIEELIFKFPEKESLLNEFLSSQKLDPDIIDRKVNFSTWLIQKNEQNIITN